jgi:hypothetical protein
MTQYARPASDITVGSWTDEGASFNDGSLYTSIQEVTQDGDTSYIDCPNGGGTAEVKLGSVNDPGVGSGHIVHVYGEGVGSGGPEKIDAWLYEGTTLIDTIASNWGPGRSGYVDLAYTLGATEADSIADYTDLRVRVAEDSIGNNEHFKITQIYLEVPDAAAAYTLIAAQGSYSLTGQTADPLRGFLVDAAQGSYNLSGQAVDPLADRVLPASQGSYSYTGQVTDFIKGYTLVAVQGSYALVGQVVDLIADRVLGAGQGSYTLNGQVVTLDYSPVGAYILVADQGAYTLTGQATGALAGRLLTALQGSYVLTGVAVTLTYTPLGAYILVAAQGSYGLTGQGTGVVADRLMAAGQGSYTLSGQDITSLVNRKLVAALGSYILTGQNIGVSFILFPSPFNVSYVKYRERREYVEKQDKDEVVQ